MTNSNDHKLKDEINHLEEAMHDADQFHTLEEQVADMKRRGIDPSSAYKKWDDDKDEDDDDSKKDKVVITIDSSDKE